LCLAVGSLGCAASQVVPKFVDPALLSTLDGVCAGRGDALCKRLRDANAAAPGEPQARAFRAALAEAARVIREKKREAALTDPALRYLARERWMALLVRHTLEAADPNAPLPGDPAQYAAAAERAIRRLYPAYGELAPDVFRLARVPLAPAKSDCGGVVVFFPGVVRVSTGDEFELTARKLVAALPCLAWRRAETSTFVDPALNARAGCKVVSELPPGAPLHLVGYSQGSRNALQTLVDCDSAKGRVRSLLSIDSAAHGSPVADLVALSRDLETEEKCADRTNFLSRWWCDASNWWGSQLTSLGINALDAFGMDEDDLRRVREHEGIDENTPVQEVLSLRANGIRSLSTYESNTFWASRAGELPRNVLYVSSRAMITDLDANLPDSNESFFEILSRAGGASPWNDMQVRMVDQRLGPPLHDLEVVSPAAEGNHWQWALEAHQVPAALMPKAMFAHIPRAELVIAHFETLGELGLLAK